MECRGEPGTGRRRVKRGGRFARLLLVGATLGGAAPLGAQQADSGRCAIANESRLTSDASGAPVLNTSARRLAAMQGRKIASVNVITTAPHSYGIGGSLHVTTHPQFIRTRLPFRPGDSVDTTRVASALRELRKLRQFAAVSLVADCADGGAVTLTVLAQDAWSLTPRLRVASAGDASFGVEETNVLGTGRAARVYVRTDRGQTSLGASYSDPSLLGSALVGTVSRDAFVDGGSISAMIRTRDRGVLATWGAALSARHSTRRSVLAPAPGQVAQAGDSVRRTSVGLLVSRRVQWSGAGATFLVGGLELDRAHAIAGAATALVGPGMARRSFAGVDLGLARRSARFVEVPWLLPPDDGRHIPRNPAELPSGPEFDAIVGVGRDAVTASPMTHLDLWAGRVWTVARGPNATPRVVLTTDVWASGFGRMNGAGGWTAGTTRFALGAFAPARGGRRSVRLVAERLSNPDPDTRGLAWSEPSLRRASGRSRLAETALSLTMERTTRLRSIASGYVLEGALFGTTAVRWDLATPGSPAARARALAGLEAPDLLPGMVSAASVGAGLRLVPRSFGRATVQFDFGYPVARSATVPARPFFAITIVPSLGLRNVRDGAGSRPTP